LAEDRIGTGTHEEPEPCRPIEVLLARHPQVVANVEGRFVGEGESPFTELGEKQSLLLAEFIAQWNPTGIYSSPRHRARIVAERASQISGVPLYVHDGLAEISFGAAEGLTYDEATKAGVAMDLLGGPPESAPFHDGETWRAFAQRIHEAGDAIKTCGSRTAVVAHGGVVRALIAHWLNLPEEAAWHFAVPNASVATLTLWDGTGTLRTFGVEPAATLHDTTEERRGSVFQHIRERAREVVTTPGLAPNDPVGQGKGIEAEEQSARHGTTGAGESDAVR
jgi:broad specificity phosphatase PhoE